MPQPKFSDFTDFLPQPERRAVRPIRNLPVNAISEENDPTLEIRTLIEQLQQTSREARTQARVAEEEKQALRQQLDQAAAQIETLRATEADLRTHFTEITTVLQERDDALGELAHRERAAAEDQKKFAAADRKCQDAQRERDEAIRQRDEARRQVETLQRTAAEAGREAAEHQRKMLALRQARDSAHATNLDLNHRVQVLESQLAEADYAGENGSKALALAQASAADLRQQLEAAALEQAAAAQQIEALTLSLDEKHRQLLELGTRRSTQEPADTDDLAALAEARQQAHGSVAELQAQVETLVQERDEMDAALQAAHEQTNALSSDRATEHDSATARAAQLEGELVALRFQLSAVDDMQAGLLQQGEELRLTTTRLENQRLETIDLANQLQTAQHELRELSASLAEARLQVKFANAASRAARHGPEITAEITSLASASAGTAGLPPLPRPAATESPEERDARETLGAMRECYHAFARNASDIDQLRQLHIHAHAFAESARVGGLVAVHRLCRSFAELTLGLHEIPERLNASTLRTVQQTIEFLALLMKERHLETLRDPAKARIFAVDDDEGNCESIELALGASMLRVTCAQAPLSALHVLSENDYDLILLDVNLPEMDGFELCRRIRHFEHHAATPIVFLTALATLENRLQSSQCGGNDFIAKPFNLSELTVKTLTLILKAHLQLA